MEIARPKISRQIKPRCASLQPPHRSIVDRRRSKQRVQLKVMSPPESFSFSFSDSFSFSFLFILYLSPRPFLTKEKEKEKEKENENENENE
jgi:hypothetical protein